MNYPVVRIGRILISNIKCVTSGNIDFNVTSALSQEKASIMGIYGQNGSGKTVVVEVLAIIKSILSGKQIASRFLDIISYGEKTGCIEIDLSVHGEEAIDCVITYKCELEQRENPNESSIENDVVVGKASTAILSVTNESLKISGIYMGVKYHKQYIAQTDENQSLIKPDNKRRLLFGDDENTLKKLEKNKILALYGSRSFIFSNQVTEVIDNTSKQGLGSIIYLIQFFARNHLFIVDVNTLSDAPFIFQYTRKESKYSGISGTICFPLGDKAVLRKNAINTFESFIPSLNLVLSSMIPGLKIGFKSKKASLDENDDKYEIELFASRNPEYEFPLRHESMGIKRIISYLALIIAVYNDSHFVLVVDEFDSSIFEFLLGELVGIIKDFGRGQLVFTSHNLRPLEKLDDTSICFTTTDPKKRYVRIKKKTTNNLRDMYFRLLSLGSSEYELYNSESKNAIAYAFRQAGWDE